MRHNGRLPSRLVFGAIVALFAATLVAVPSRPASAAVIGDDYPARIANRNVDPWLFYSGECTSFVAWRINHELKFDFDDYWLVHWGNASNWRNAARNAKVRAAGVRFDHTPKVGAIAWWSAHSAGSSLGHVAWVAMVNKTSITIEEYNYLHHHEYDVRTIPRSDVRWPSGFIHFPPAAIANTKPPQIHGKVRVGETLRTTKGRWNVGGKKYAYQWFAGGEPIRGATAQTYPVRPESVLKPITVRVTASKKGYRKQAAVSEPTRPVLRGRFTSSAAPTIEGTAQVGLPLSATTGSWDPAGSYSYQWFSAGEPVDGATGSTFVPGPAQVGTRVNVRVTAATYGYRSKNRRASNVLVAPGRMEPVARPAIDGPAQVGRALRVRPARWDVGTARVRYQWFAGGTPIAGAQGTTFTPTAEQVGTRLSVVATATARGYRAATMGSTSTAPVTRGTVAFRGRVRVTGHRLLGHRLVAHAPATRPAGARLEYQWFRGRHRIKGATGRTYRTVRPDVGRHLQVRVTGSAASWTSGSIGGKRLALVRSFPVIRARASVSGPRERYVRVRLRIRAPGVDHVIGRALVFEGKRRVGAAVVRQGRATVTVGTLRPGTHQLRVRFRAQGASRSGTARLVVRVG